MATHIDRHGQGLALVFGSLPGLILAAFDQASILAFYYRVEKPHYEQLCRPAYDAVSGLVLGAWKRTGSVA